MLPDRARASAGDPVSAPAVAPAAPARWIVVGALLPVLAQLLALFNPDFVVVDCEERFNAAHGVSLAMGHWDALLDLQYRKFCGGCTFTAAAAALPFSVLAPSFGAWKLVPLAFTAAIGAVGTAALWRHGGRGAAVLFVLLVVLAPPAWIRLALLAWGNHYEAGLWCLALAALAARPRLSDRAHLGVGLLVGVALWFGFSSTYAVLGLVGVRAVQRRTRALVWLAAGALLAPALWAAQLLSTDQHPFGTIYSPGEAVPSLARLPHKLHTLLAPQQWAGLFSVNNVFIGFPVGIACLVAAVLGWGEAARRGLRRLREHGAGSLGLESVLAGMLTVWLALYLVVEFKLELRAWPAVPSAAGLRYAAPWMPLLWALLALVAARWWEQGRRRAAVVLVLPHVAGGLVAKAAVLSDPFPSAFAFSLDAPDHENFRYINSYALDPRDQRACSGTDPDHQAAHAFSAGRHETQGWLPRLSSFAEVPLAPLPPEADFYAGVGQATVDARDSDAVGGVGVLEEVWELVGTLPPAGQTPAMAEAVWWRAFRDDSYGFARGPLFSEATLVRLLRQAAPLDPVLRRTVLHALGRRWGVVHGRWGQPGAVPWPAVDVGPRAAEGLATVAEGLGMGLGTKWGPGEGLPVPEGLPVELHGAYLEGLQAGVALQWSGGTVSVDPEAQWPDAGAERWWGPAPTMYCPCKASCW